jgi:subtilisin family serine protease
MKTIKFSLFIVADTSQLNLTTDFVRSNFKRDVSTTHQIRQDYTRRYYQKLTLPENLLANQYRSKTALIKQNNADVVVAPYFTNQSGDEIGLSNFLYVKLKTLGDTTVLKQQVNNHNAVVVYQDKFMPLWFVISVTSLSNLNAMELANAFYESGLFQYAEPDLMGGDHLDCVNDTYFNNQWGLNNTGQNGGTAGIDINACDAWQISTGSNIIVAVLDEGVDLTHPDLVANIHSQSYDTENGTSPSIIRGDHGTACTGIIGAVRNNSTGIAGVAPDCQIMSISNQMTNPTPASRQQRGEGINWAVAHGADVISNSWGSSVQYQIIDDAINNAVTQGRNGKGCVVVFASGNDYATSVSYPASLSNVIAVGAINRNGQRADFSNYGTALDVVAPGVLIPTTDRQGNNGYNYITTNTNDPAYSDYSNKDYTGKFNGTSSACPHVAGVAALILSVRPDLTQSQVRQAIESTCTKLSGYSYSSNSSHPNGTWNNQTGHGLVNAYAALRSLLFFNIVGATHFCGTGTFSLQNVYNESIPGNYTASWTVTRKREAYGWESATNGEITIVETYNTPTITLNTNNGMPEYIQMSVTIRDQNNTIADTHNLSATSGCFAPYVGTLYWWTGNWPNVQDGETTYQSYGNTLYLTPGENISIELTYTDNTGGYYPGGINVADASIDGNQDYQAIHYSSNWLSINVPSNAYYTWENYLNISLQNSCSTGHSFKIPIQITSSYYSSMSIYPNPASDVINIEIGNTASGTLQESKNNAKKVVYNIQLYDKYGNLLKKSNIEQGKIQFDVSDLTNDIYCLNISDNISKKTETRTIIVAH